MIRPTWYVPWIVKYGTTGEVIWWRNPESTGNKDMSGIVTDWTGNVIVSGGKWLWEDGYLRTVGGGWIVKYSPTGDLLWTRPLLDRPVDMATDDADNILTSGIFNDVASNACYVWVTKHSPDGKYLWKWRTRTGPAAAACDLNSPSIAADVEGNVLISGTMVDAHGRQCAWVAKLRP